MNATTTAFGLLLVLFAVVGAAAARHAKATTRDYLVAGRSVGPWLTAVSAWATAHSGFGFIGQIGFIYTTGISALWLTVGWFFGDYLAWRLAFPRLRARAAGLDAQTWPQVVAAGSGRVVRVAAAVLTVVMLATYAAAQLQAGAKAMHTVTGWTYEVGVGIGALLIVGYSAAGGVRATIWTDAAQSAVMLTAMLILGWVGVVECGGIDSLIDTLARIDPALLSVSPRGAAGGPVLFVLGWIIAGLGVIGQPHVMVRLLSVRGDRDVTIARRINVSMSLVFTVASLAVGLSARVLLPDLGAGDPEQALPVLAGTLLPGAMVGAVLAAIFAASISTADSQVLVSAAALTTDLTLRQPRVRVVKIGTLLVIVLMTTLAWWQPSNVFGLVVTSWSVLAVSLGPVVFFATWRGPTSSVVSLGAMLVGIVSMLGWRALGWGSALHEVVPGVLLAIVVLQMGPRVDTRRVRANRTADRQP
ncbi:MAG: sodium/proline symporter [Myxococcota bacterium]